MERRFHSPYKHWVSGLFIEVGILIGFGALLVALSYVVVWAVGL